MKLIPLTSCISNFQPRSPQIYRPSDHCHQCQSTRPASSLLQEQEIPTPRPTTQAHTGPAPTAYQEWGFPGHRETAEEADSFPPTEVCCEGNGKSLSHFLGEDELEWRSEGTRGREQNPSKWRTLPITMMLICWFFAFPIGLNDAREEESRGKRKRPGSWAN